MGISSCDNTPGGIQSWEFLNKSGGDLLWDVIEKSRKGAEFDSFEQDRQLRDILSTLSEDDYNDVLRHWRGVLSCIESNPNFDLLHISNGGIVDGGDDSFYMDFGHWVVAQGKELCDGFIRNGHKTIIKYIEDNNISEDDYTYECMAYCFDRDED